MKIKTIAIVAFLDDGTARQIFMDRELSKLVQALVLPMLSKDGKLSVSSDIFPLIVKEPE